MPYGVSYAKVYVCHTKSCHTSCQRGHLPRHTSSHTTQSLMAKNVIALSYVYMTPPMTNRKIVKRKSYRRMTICYDMIFFCGGLRYNNIGRPPLSARGCNVLMPPQMTDLAMGSICWELCLVSSQC